MFFRIDSRTPSISHRFLKADEEDKQIAQWSGNWGMRMFIQQNFIEITEEYYRTLHPPVLEDDKGEDTFPFPGYFMPQKDYRKHALAAACMTEPKMQRVKYAPAQNLTPELMRMIMKNLSIDAGHVKHTA